MKLMHDSVRNSAIASLYPGAIAAVPGTIFMGVWALALGAGYASVYFLIYLLVGWVLKRSNFNKSIIAHGALSALIPFIVMFIGLTLFTVGDSVETSLIFSFLGLVGGLYLGYLNKTS
ncbi:hypothetical protein [Arenicella xantha]|uniref:Uncharacterized protein n=1 Tax=Arenicella xantha TaxID=644221 RepID=A0A395JE89_9GAMM|nr:hypothetical protein [Arenicella xantha]RBP45467.1 hypothetical protein DFR28_1194 [Arenicella xantha]